MNAPARKPLPALGLQARAARYLSVLLPTLEPAAALRLTCYLGGLLCFDAITEYTEKRIKIPPLLVGVRFQLAVLIINILLVAGLVCFFVACLSTPPRLGRLLPSRRVLLAGGLMATLLLAGRGLLYVRHIPGVIATPHHYGFDALAYNDCATQSFLHGQNPYTAFSPVACLARNGLPGSDATPLQAGAFAYTRFYPSTQELNRVFEQARRHHVHRPAELESYFFYPAGSFVFAAPIMALGWHELSLFWLLCLLLGYLVLAWRAPPRLRPWLVPLALANLTIWWKCVQFGGGAESLDVLLLLVGWATWRRSWLSAVLMGAAIATRQNAWFFVPFYAILIGRTYGWRALAQRGAVIAAVFALLNGPFALQSPMDWLNSVLGPLRVPLFPTTATSDFGLVAFARWDWVPLWPRQTYAVLGLVAMAACALLYARICRRQPGIGLVLAVVPFLLAWRSVDEYFTPLTLFCLWPLLEDLRAEEGRDGKRVSDSRGLKRGRLRRGRPTSRDQEQVAVGTR